MSRYHRQSLLPQIGPAGQAKLAASRVTLVGCGALGTVIADQLVRAGVGHLRIIDRDLVELTNLQRQVLYGEEDVKAGLPKAVAAANRLRAANSEVTIDPVVADVHAGNIEALAEVERMKDGIRMKDEGGRMNESLDANPDSSFRLHSSSLPDSSSFILHPSSLLLDGTDNAETRYLLNDVAIRHGIPWVYGACVGIEGRVMPIIPGVTPCLRCVFPNPPGPGELPTCDTAGVLGPAAAIVGAMQASLAIQLLVGDSPANQLVRFDLWRGRFGATPLDDARRPDCPACGESRFDFLDAPAGAGSSTSLCGRNAVQVRPAASAKLDLSSLAARLGGVGDVQRTPYLLRFRAAGETESSLTVFPDGRAIIHGVTDPARARSVYAKWIGL